MNAYAQAQNKIVSFLRRAERSGATGTGGNETITPGQEVCIANIGPKERRRRLMSGVVGMSIGVLLAAVMVGLHLHALLRLLLFFPFAGGATGYFQAADKT